LEAWKTLANHQHLALAELLDSGPALAELLATRPEKCLIAATAVMIRRWGQHVYQSMAYEAWFISNILDPMMGALEATMLASVNKKGAGSFTLPGLLKVTALQVPAKKKRVGIDPFTKQERTFAAKPAIVKLKVRSLKKLKDAAL